MPMHVSFLFLQVVEHDSLNTEGEIS
jgi:hypothetical protein